VNAFRFSVSPRGKGYVAKSVAPEATAMGSMPEEAVESARQMALALFGEGPRPTKLIVYLNKPGTRTTVMHPIDKAFTLTAPLRETSRRYMASLSNAAPATEAADD
jgi:hypothetical protein